MVDYRSLVGRQWEYGKADCFTLVRDWFKLQGVELPDYERPKSTETCESIFLDQAELIGFQAGDAANPSTWRCVDHENGNSHAYARRCSFA